MPRPKASVEPLGEVTLSPTRRSSLATLSDACLAVEKLRVASEVRLSHLQRRRQSCSDTEELLRRSKDLEDWADSRLTSYLADHPACWWFSHIKGVGMGEVIAKILGRIEDFGRWYDVGDPMIPPYVTREPEVYEAKTEHGFEDRVGIWVEGIERLTTSSKLRVFAGHAPGMRRQKGKKIPYDSQLKMLVWREGENLMRATGSYYAFYHEYRFRILQGLEVKGIKVMPTPKARFCPDCMVEVKAKNTKYCPDCGKELTKKEEPPGVLFEGHLHLRYRRRMQQLFLDHLHYAWRKTLGLPLRQPYAIEFLGHSRIITAESMMDKHTRGRASQYP